MALSGNYYEYPLSYSGGDFGLYVEWSATQNAVENYSDITQRIYLSYRQLNIQGRTGAKSSINGVEELFDTAAINDMTKTWKKKLLHTQTVRVNHNTDGTKTVELKADFPLNATIQGTSLTWIRASATVDIDTIDRAAPTVTHSTSNITANSFKISAVSSSTIDLWYYSLDGGNTYTQISAPAGTSANVTVTGLAPNTSYSVRVKARKQLNQVYGYSTAAATKTLGGSILTAVQNTAIDVQAPVLKFSVTVFDSSYYHRLNVKNGTTLVMTVDLGQYPAGAAQAKTYTLTAAQRTAMLNQIPSEQSFEAEVEMLTYSDSGYRASVGSASGKKARMTTSAAISRPTFTEFTFEDTRAQTVAATENNQVLIQKYSFLQVNATAGTAKNGATIVGYAVTVGEVSKRFPGTTMNVGAIRTTGSLLLTVKCVDSRGYVTPVGKTVKVLEYEKPKISSCDLRRRNEIEATIELTFAGLFSSIKADGTNETNALTYAGYYYRKTSDEQWSQWASFLNDVTVNGNNFSFSTQQLMLNATTALSLDADYSYDFHLLIRDKLNEIASCDLYEVVPPGTPLVTLRKRDTAHPFGRVGINNPNPQRPMDVAGAIGMNGFNVMGTVAAELPEDTNYNSLTEQGIYFQRVSAGENTNAPAQTIGVLEVFSPSANLVIQRFVKRDAPHAVYVRAKVNQSWGVWENLIAPSQGGGEGAPASNTIPKMDGIANAGIEEAYARGDHVHPESTSAITDADIDGICI